jgi:hypothetical protein
LVDPGVAVGKQFFHVSDDDLQIRMPVKDAGADQPQQTRSGFHRPTPGGYQSRTEGLVAHIRGRLRRIGRMNVDRDLQCGSFRIGNRQICCLAADLVRIGLAFRLIVDSYFG